MIRGQCLSRSHLLFVELSSRRDRRHPGIRRGPVQAAGRPPFNSASAHRGLQNVGPAKLLGLTPRRRRRGNIAQHTLLVLLMNFRGLCARNFYPHVIGHCGYTARYVDYVCTAVNPSKIFMALTRDESTAVVSPNESKHGGRLFPGVPRKKWRDSR